jgi:tetratricopeptide (TPR) repeat protein
MFNSYIQEFADGKFIINAHYYRGDCNLRAGEADSALVDFSFVIDKPKNIFTESSLLNAANLNLKKGNDSLAYELFNRLENSAEVKANLLIARKGQMQAAFAMKDYDKAIEAARRVLITDKLPEEDIRQARMIMGKSYQAKKLLDAAIVQYRILALDVKNKEGAESKYRVAEILKQQMKLDEAEKTALDFINTGTTHQYWLAKSFILLSDIYLEKGDRFQAKANLQVLFDNYTVTDDGILDEATKKFDAIILKENRQFKNDSTKIE